MMKKHPKARQFALSAVASALLAMPAIVSAGNVSISQDPLLGVSKVTPSVVLAVSVEFPTALPAYTKQEFDLAEAKTSHLGYFDSNKCYRYVVTTAPGQQGGFKDYLLQDWGQNWSGFVGDGYFEESGNAQTNGDYVGLCPGDLDWSGNMLNFMTMSALDIFRQTLTGGNRAKGVGGASSVYSAGDPTGANESYLRRAMLWRGTEDQEVFPDSTGQGQVNAAYGQKRLFAPEVYKNDFISNFVPKGFLDESEKDRIVKAGKGRDGHFAVKMQSGRLYRNYPKTQNDPNGPNRWSEVTGDSWHDQMAEGGVSGTVDINNNTLDNLRTMIDQMYDQPIVFENAGTGFYGTLQGRSSSLSIPTNTTTTTTAQVPWFNVVVKKSEKPIGLLQERADMRTAVMGYLNEKSNDTSAGDGGVLRAKMARVTDKEINSDGSFVLNPYPADASASGVANSGVINYVNKFGDRAQYDNKDPVSELYYTAIRYLRNGAWQWDGTDDNGNPKQKRSGTAGALPYTLPNSPTEVHKDGFPVITTWDDPLKAEKDTDKDMQCYAPSIIVLGDVNTHSDGSLPNFKNSSITDDNVAKEKDGTTSYQKVCELQGRCATSKTNWFESSGANSNDGGRLTSLYAPTWGLAGMAYWVKTNNVRPDIVRDDGKPTHISSFFIDVLESELIKTHGSGETVNNKTPATSDEQILNSYYLAGKFASPDYEVDKTYTAADFNSKTGDRSLWTYDKWDPAATNKGSSNKFFPLGMPKNYAVANDPQNMRNALINAFKTVGFANNTMQSAIQYNNNGSAKLNEKGQNGAQGLLNDGLIRKLTNADGSEHYEVVNKGAIATRARDENDIPLALRAGYRFSERTGFLIASVLLPGVKDKDGEVKTPLTEVEIWEGGKKLFDKYHGNPTDRKVESRSGGVKDIKQLAPTNDFTQWVEGNVIEDGTTNYYNDIKHAATSAELINYILGDSSKEGEGGLRQRKGSLLGTSVYSSVTTFRIDGKTYAAMSSNEGMLHIFDMAGDEKYAYMPQTALPYIANFANPNYATANHRYVNDGQSVLHQAGGRNYLVGTSGRGASSVYAIDVTTTNFDAKLEINARDDSDIGILVSGPLVIDTPEGTRLVFSSGYNPKSGSDTGYLFFADMDGNIKRKVKLGTSGVGAPFGYDANGDGTIDRIYAGDHDGHVWRVNTAGSATEGEKLFNCTKDCQPITSRPVAGRASGGATVVLVGTGEYFSFADLTDASQNYAYGFIDEDGTAKLTSDNLLVQEFGYLDENGTLHANHSKSGADGNTYFSVTNRKMEDGHKGWKLVLPQGYVITSDSGFYGPNKEIATYTATKINEKGNRSCNVNGSTMLIAVDAQNGGAYKQSIFDVDGDRTFSKEDFDPAGYSYGAVVNDNIISPNTGLIDPEKDKDGPDEKDDDGKKKEPGACGKGQTPNYATFTDGNKTKYVALNPFGRPCLFRRVSWREIF